MPESISYRISQTREVKVRANSLAGAVRIAEVAFRDGQNADATINRPEDGSLGEVWGNTSGHIVETDIRAKRCY